MVGAGMGLISLASYYLTLKYVHIGAVICSGCLFASRAAAGLGGWKHALHPVLRFLSYGIDIVLLFSATCLAVILDVGPFVTGWLTVKVGLLFVYIVLGSIALKRGRSRTQKGVALVAAVAVFLFIASVALSHDPRGLFAWLAVSP